MLLTYLPAVLHGLALLIALFVQNMDSPLAGAWLPLHLAACAFMVHRTPSRERGLVWWASLGWLVALLVQTFFLRPVAVGSAFMWVLAAAPLLALSLRREYLRAYVTVFLGVLVAYAVLLSWEATVHIQYTAYQILVESRNNAASAWPLLDPNNAACVMNLGLLSCLFMGLRRPRWLALVALFAFALFCTASKAGALVALLGTLVLVAERFYLDVVDLLVLVLLVCLGIMFHYDFDVTKLEQEPTVAYRLELWTASAPLALINPLTGLGLGQYPAAYAQVRTDVSAAFPHGHTGGWYAHNDPLQFAIEMGLPAAFIFLALVVAVALGSWRGNAVAAVPLLSLFLQALIEFQFYVPLISLLAGLSLGYHRLNRRPSRYDPRHVSTR